MNDQPVADEAEADPWRVRWHDYLPPAALVVAMLITWLGHNPARGMASWGVSAAGLVEGRLGTIFQHFFAHGSVLHLLMNSAALLEIGGLVVARLGSFPQGWLRFVAGFIFGGLGGVVLFLSFNPQGQVAMIGASGAVYALVGLLLGIRLVEAFEPVPLRLLPNAFLSFIDNNRLFLLILLVGGVLAAVPSRVAWEAHLGGFMLGLCLGPWLLPPLEDSHALRAR